MKEFDDCIDFDFDKFVQAFITPSLTKLHNQQINDLYYQLF